MVVGLVRWDGGFGVAYRKCSCRSPIFSKKIFSFYRPGEVFLKNRDAMGRMIKIGIGDRVVMLLFFLPFCFLFLCLWKTIMLVTALRLPHTRNIAYCSYIPLLSFDRDSN